MKYTKVLKEAIDAYWREHYCSPSYRDLIEATGMKSLSHLKLCLEALVQEGYILPALSKGRTRAVIPYWVEEAIRESNEGQAKSHKGR